MLADLGGRKAGTQVPEKISAGRAQSKQCGGHLTFSQAYACFQ